MIKKIFLLTLAALMLALCICGCNSGQDQPSETEETIAATDAETVGGILLSGENKVRIIFPDGNKEIKTIATKIYDKLINLAPVGQLYSLSSDKAAPNGQPEILVGLTNRAESEQARSSLEKYYDYTITTGDKNIAIYANTNDRLESAVKYFVKNMKADNNGNVYYTLSETYVDVFKGNHPSANIDAKPLKDYKIVISAEADQAQKDAADKLALMLEKICGISFTVSSDATPASELEILLGKTSRQESELPSDFNDRLLLINEKVVMSPSTSDGYSRLITLLENELELRRGNLKASSLNVTTLSYDAIRSVSFGAVNITEQTDGLRFNKFSDKQIELWTTYNRYNEAACSTGIRLDFYTNSKALYFRASQAGNFELFVNGESVQRNTAGIIEAELDNTTENRVTILFPNHKVNTTLVELRLDEGATLTPYEYQRKFLILGDSITQGYSAATDSLSWANRITRMFDADSVIQAISGGTFQASTLDPDVDFTPDYILVAYGTNDWSSRSSMEDFKAAATAYYQRLAELYPDATIIGITPIWRKDTETRRVGEFDDACAELKAIIESVGGYAVNGVDLVPHERKYYGEDICLHPNNEGFEFYANNLYEEIKDIIK